jgi:hypothetical protein
MRQPSGALGSDECRVRFESGGGPPQSRTLPRSLKETSRFPASFLFRRKLNKIDVDFNFI